ncbi:hypothetical protein Pla123a_09650 [Posidoniimonas polymericola]|uniref:Uncharacterized protein n=1 Tax=Posidoniimonas polymericola TaxID=2528002 RepID=A0A5C5YT87_9BACT|nr:hypothetical protein [Posidoniimonas polymericola]TWT78175.1 hypothetical protein Pla123a_09650 [Posidoniimonas polymericola]
MNRFKHALAITLLLSIGGCGGYGEVSPVAYDYSMALYSLANRQDGGKLDAVAEQIDASHAAGDLTDREAGWLHDILADAESGDWQSASASARRMMQDQVKR